jgi:hypothetical protein|tara:strand:+ start:88 stop:285 length:198 start_codon:yes stop_codon:yes gene_type:complete
VIFGMDITFDSEKASSIIDHCEQKGMDEMESWLHCMTVAAGLCPSKEMTLAAVEMIYSSAEEIVQ